MADYARIYLSPHLDDAVLSCGGQIARLAREGERVLVVTVFAGDEPAGALSDLALRLHRAFGLKTGVVAARRAEDEEACRLLGAEAVHWDEPDALYRLDPATGDPLYERLADLFGASADPEPDLHDRLAKRLRELPAAGSVVAPLGAGGHVDHHLVRAAAEEVFGRNLLYYQEDPYSQRWRALGRALGRRREWKPQTLALDDDDLRAKIDAIRVYRSQVGPLFGSPGGVERAVRRRARRLGGERLWQRTAT